MSQAAIKLIKSNDGPHQPARNGSTAIGDIGRAARLAKAYRDLETDLYDLRSMAHLVGATVFHAIGDDTSDVTGHEDKHFLPRMQAETTLWAVYHLEDMIKAVDAKYHAALDGEG